MPFRAALPWPPVAESHERHATLSYEQTSIQQGEAEFLCASSGPDWRYFMLSNWM